MMMKVEDSNVEGALKQRERPVIALARNPGASDRGFGTPPAASREFQQRPRNLEESYKTEQRCATVSGVCVRHILVILDQKRRK